jgi:hypothetical protein
LEESVCVCYGGVDSYDFHGYETAQCMSERRAGGEVGVRAIHAVRQDRLWEMLDARPETVKLLEAALARSHTLTPPDGYSFGVPSVAWARKAAPGAIGFFVEHRDGFLTTVLLLNGLVQDFTYAGRLKGQERPVSCQMYLPMPPARASLANFFNPLVNNIEEMVLTGKAPYPVERTLLTSGMTLFGVESLHRGGARIETPEMNVAYVAPIRSTFWRA